MPAVSLTIILGATEALGGSEIARTLRPLLLECIVGSNRLPEAVASEAVEHRDSTPLSQVTHPLQERPSQ